MQSREERCAEYARFKLLLSFGADPNQRGINDYTALHHEMSRPLAAQEARLDGRA
jgi:ankyrin repeat protein